jgi:hypothetical protein
MPKTAKTAEAEPEAPDVQSLKPLLEGMITLLGRLVYTPEKLITTVTFKKHNPEQYISIYDLCDGEHTGTEIAKHFNHDQGALSRILSDWKELGIVYEVSKKGKMMYKKLYKLEEPKKSASKETKPETEVQAQKTTSPAPPKGSKTRTKVDTGSSKPIV